MAEFHVEVGERATFSKTVGESDVYLFAGITGDLAPNHVDQRYMQATQYGERIAHGALLVGFMSTTSTMIAARSVAQGDETPVSLGYDRIRFLAPVFIGDTITVEYVIASIDVDRRRSIGDIRITRQDGTLAAVGTHVMQWVPRGK